MERVDLGPCLADVHRPEAPGRLVLLPGAHYRTQAPLLWFAREVALARGLGALEVLDEAPASEDRFAWPLDRARRALDFEPAAERCAVIGKSLTSAAAGLAAERGLPALWLTPLLDQRIVLDGLAGASAPTVLVGGTADEVWRPAALPDNPALEVVELPGLDHVLQVPGDPRASLAALERVTEVVDDFLDAAFS